MSRTPSESLFEEYLVSKGLILDKDFFYEPDLGKSTRPDYLVKSLEEIIFEIKEFTRDKQIDKALKESGGMVTFSGNPYIAIRRKIQETKRQFKPFRTEYPCVLVLHKGSSISVSTDVQLVAAAAYGDLSLNERYGWHFGKNNMLSPSRNRTFSAICIIEELYPERESASKLFLTKNKPQPTDKIIDIEKKFGEWSKTNGYDLSKKCVRLQVIVNTAAYKQISTSFFTGELDEIYTTDATGTFGRSK